MTQARSFPTTEEKAISRAGVFDRRELATLTLLFLAGLLSRLPFAGQVLYHWDSINFALALEQFDLAAEQPHLPGYPLYVALGRLVAWVFATLGLPASPQAALVAISITASALAAVFLYKLGCQIYDRRTGLLAAAFLLASPLFWFYGEVALPHALDALAVIVVAWLFYRLSLGYAHVLIPAAIVLGVAGGLRPQTEVFLAPLGLFALAGLQRSLARSGRGRRFWLTRGLAALAVLALGNLAWFVPLVASSGGLASYLSLLSAFSERYNRETSLFQAGLRGLGRNLLKLGMYTAYGLGLALVPLGLGGLVWLYARLGGARSARFGSLSTGPEPAEAPGVRRPLFDARRPFFDARRLLFFAFWILPPLAYYLLIHMGQQGLVFVFLPALLLLAAAGVYRLGKWLRARISPGRALHAGLPAFVRLAALAIVLANGSIFLAAPTYPLGDAAGESSPKLLTLDTLRRHDTAYLPRLAQIPERFSPRHALLLSADWRFPQYFLPEYVLLPYGVRSRWELGAGRPVGKDEIAIDPAGLGLRPGPQGDFTLILLEDRLLPFNASPDRVEWLPLGEGQRLAYMRLSPQESILLSPAGYGIVPANGQ